MDSADDDFGELYVDANVQATASSAGDSRTVKSSEESELDPRGVPKKFVAVANDSSPCALNRIEESSYTDSDSDDDLDIVLKDDDSKPLLPPPPASSSFTNNGGYACFESSLGMLQCGYSFSYPWFRTSFEKKPWRNPGMDVSDFFNFGLNEQSWNDYCKPLGRAIEVESGTLERQPSADSRPPRDSDPDVVIQVPVTDYVEELPSLKPMEARSRSRSMSSNEACRSDDSRSDNRRGLKPFDDSVKDEAFVGCLDDNAGSSSGEQSTPTENCCSREVALREKEMIEEKKEERLWNSDGAGTSSTENESSSRGDRIRISPTSSSSVGKNEESEDYETESLRESATDDQREVSTPPRHARRTEHKVVSFRSGERSDRKHSRQRRSREDSKERHCGRDGYDVHKHRTIKDESHTPEADLGKKVCSRPGSSYRDSIKSWHNGRRFISETEGRGFRHSNREKCHDVRHREQRFGQQNNKESAWGRGFDHSNNLYKHEAHLQEHTSRSSFNVNQRNYRSSFKEEDDRYSRHHCEEKYGHERSPALACERNKERYRYERVRESYHQDVDDRCHLEYSYSHGNPRQSHENELHFRRSDDEYDIDLRRYEDRVHRGEIKVPIEPAYREMHSFTAVRRREFHGYVRNDEFPDIDRRRGYTPDWHHRDRFVSEKDAWPAPSLSLRDHCYTGGRRGDSWRDDIRDFTTEAYDGQNGRLYKPAPRDDWTQKHVNIQDRLTYEDDWVHRDRRRYPLEDEIQYSMREVARSDHPSYRDEILFHDIRMPIHNRLSTKQRSGYFKNHAHEIDERHRRFKKQRGDRQNTFTECQNPNLAGRQGKLSTQSKRRLSNGGGTIAKSNGQKPRKLVCRGNENTVQIGDLNDKEEGEIVEETRIVKGGVEVMNNERIQESLKKMEKRRERFKETKCVNTVEETTFEPRAKADDFTNQQRPFRKRRWYGGA